MVRAEIQLLIVPVSDADRSKEFYGSRLGWHVDYDQVVSPELRFVQITPPRSACSIAFGIGLSTMEPALRATSLTLLAASRLAVSGGVRNAACLLG